MPRESIQAPKWGDGREAAKWRKLKKEERAHTSQGKLEPARTETREKL